MAECNDQKCAKHGKIKVRGNIFSGKVVSSKSNKTVIIEMTLTKKIPKYERYKKIRSKIAAHNPECINAKENDFVKIGETRKISKTKSFVVLEVIKNESN
jgi:small subunit ribosomal protein S17